MKRIIKYHKVLILLIFIQFLYSCNESGEKILETSEAFSYIDEPFIQETHQGYIISDCKTGNQVRSITADINSNIWIATASGIFRKNLDETCWVQIITGEERGPAYSVFCNSDGDILMGTWNGLWRYSNGSLTKDDVVKPPVSVICSNKNGDYALGPYGIWRFESGSWKVQPYKIARSVRDAIADSAGNLWVATDGGDAVSAGPGARLRGARMRWS